MAVVNFPNVSPDSESWTLQANTQTFTSPLNGATQTSELPGARWEASLTFTNRTTAEAKRLQGFLTGLRGRAGRFYLIPFDSTPTGTAAGSGIVSGAGQTGGELITSGWTINQPLLLAAGDYIEVNGELKQITQDIASDGSGNATLIFSPDLTQAPAGSSPIVTVDPKAVMRLDDDAQASWDFRSGNIYAISISCVEAIDI